MRIVALFGLSLALFFSCTDACPELQTWDAPDDIVAADKVCPGMSKYADFNVEEVVAYLQNIRLTLEKADPTIPVGTLPEEITFASLKRCWFGNPKVPSNSGPDCIPHPWFLFFHKESDPYPHLDLSIDYLSGLKNSSLVVMIDSPDSWDSSFRLETQTGWENNELVDSHYYSHYGEGKSYDISYRVSLKNGK